MVCYKIHNKISGIVITAMVLFITLAWSNNSYANNCIDTSHKKARDASFEQSKKHQQNIQPVDVRQQFGTPAKQIGNIMSGGQSADKFKNLIPQMQGGISGLLGMATKMLSGIMSNMMGSMGSSNIFGSSSGSSCKSPTKPQEGDPR